MATEAQTAAAQSAAVGPAPGHPRQTGQIGHMGRVIFFDMRVAPEHRAELLEALLEHGRLAAADEPGMLRFDVLEDDQDPNRLFLYEAYADEAAFRTHLAGESHKAAAALLTTLREQSKVGRDVLVRMHSATPAR